MVPAPKNVWGRMWEQQAPHWMECQGDHGVWGAVSTLGAQGGVSGWPFSGLGVAPPQPSPRCLLSLTPGARGWRCSVAAGPAGAAGAGLQEKELERDLCTAPLYY